MTDHLTSEQRHRCMAAIRGKNTRPEMIVRRFLWSRGFRYRLNHPWLPGKPDIVLSKYKAVIFINGCFWHGHDGCKDFVIPKSNTAFWLGKIDKNKERDTLDGVALASAGWKVITIWECELKKSVIEATLDSLVQALVSR